MTDLALAVRLTAATVAADLDDDLVGYADPSHPLVWLRDGGMVGIGEAWRIETTGPTRFADAAAAWTRLVADAAITDEVGVRGTGLVAFASFAFADDSASASALVVPRVVLGRRDGVSWITRISVADDANAGEPSTDRSSTDEHAADAPPPLIPAGPDAVVALEPGDIGPGRYRAMVLAATTEIAAGAVEKVVIARDAVGAIPSGTDLRHPLRRLAAGYPDCWTFAVDGLVGASPETLIAVRDGRFAARALAGSAPRGADAAADDAAVAALTASPKDLAEHAFAADSVIDVLRPHALDVDAGGPLPLKLPNVWHLATRITGEIADGSSVLDLVAALHPTAAVAGTPTVEAARLLRRIEDADRGRYAGPVGWIDDAGDGEFAIALRSAEIADGRLVARAGAGIVAGSVPADELAETALKLRPITEAFAGPAASTAAADGIR